MSVGFELTFQKCVSLHQSRHLLIGELLLSQNFTGNSDLFYKKNPFLLFTLLPYSQYKFVEATAYTMSLGNGHTPKHNNDPLHLQLVGNAPQHLCALLQTKT